MKASYGQLIREHDLIETAANALLSDLRNPSVGSVELAFGLDTLADAVEAHIEVEDGIVSAFDRDSLGGPWALAWNEGVAGFERLRSDWIAFLGHWDATAITRDRAGFNDTATAILGCLRSRVQAQTRAFYATALQTNAIDLR